MKRELESNNLELLRNKVNRYIHSFILLIERLLEGSIIGGPDTYGETLLEEKAASGRSVASGKPVASDRAADTSAYVQELGNGLATISNMTSKIITTKSTAAHSMSACSTNSNMWPIAAVELHFLLTCFLRCSYISSALFLHRVSVHLHPRGHVGHRHIQVPQRAGL